MRVLIAGATGALGRPLVPLLVAARHQVWGTTRRTDRHHLIADAGATPLTCDALDRASLERTLDTARPEAVVHHLTALPTNWGSLRRGTPETDRLRREGTQNLVDAAVNAGVRRLVAESIAFLYAAGHGPAPEDDPAWLDAPGRYADTISAVLELERISQAAALDAVVLRYGALYGPDTWWAADGDIVRRIRQRALPVIGDGAGMTSFLHVDDAAHATARALDPSIPPDVYNVVDDDPVSFAALLPTVAASLGARPPRNLPQWLARPLAGAAGTAVMTQQRAADNTRAKDVLGWSPERPTWRERIGR